jgi:hypothetical protein
MFPAPDGLLTIEGRKINEVFESIFIGDISIEKGLADISERYNKALQDAVSEGKVDLDMYTFDVDIIYEE